MVKSIKQSWFRMYAEFATDPKVQMLSEVMQRRYIMLLCLRCNGDVTLHDDEAAFQLRISNEDMDATKQCLMERGLIDENLNPAKWDKRQFTSDSSVARVQKHREAKKTAKKQPCNVTVTPPETDTETDTDTEYKKSKPKKRAKISYSSFPTLPKKEILDDWLQVRKTKRLTMTQTAVNAIGKELHKAVDKGFSIDECFETMVVKSWGGFELQWLENLKAQGLATAGGGKPDKIQRNNFAETEYSEVF
ncbi:MAG: hypothetical protein R8M45_08390 [Ghiorsea sp.]